MTYTTDELRAIHDQKRVKELICERVRLELQLLWQQGQRPPEVAVGAYTKIFPKLIYRFVFGDRYPFDLLRSVRENGRSGNMFVYVLLLDPKAKKDAEHNNWKRGKPDMPCVYVGETGKSIDERYADHAVGHNSKEYIGANLLANLPLIHNQYNPCRDRTESRAIEKALGIALHRAGCTVFGAH